MDCQLISNAQLTFLLTESESEVDSTELELHVEECKTCQLRLSQLAACETIESEASQLLTGFPLSSSELDHSYVQGIGLEDESGINFDQGVLSPPMHPEMMGRIGRYEVERLVGSGGMGVVFKAFDTELNRPVAVKVLAPHLARNGAARQRFSRESRAAATVAHENVVAIHNVESNCKHPYLVMQFVQGESLQFRVDRDGPLAPERIIHIGVQIAQGLAAAHQHGIIHRDIKPANILLESNVDRLLITDFGLARMVDDASLTHTGLIAGTPNYMSPEQAKGEDVDFRTDLFSLGSLLYFLATGHPPFRAENAMGVLHRICHTSHRPIWQANPSVPDSLCAIVDRLLEKNPSKRFANANAVADTLTRQLQAQNWRRSTYATCFSSWIHRNPLGSVGLATFALIVTTVLIWIGASRSSYNSNRIPTSSDNAAIRRSPGLSGESLDGFPSTPVSDTNTHDSNPTTSALAQGDSVRSEFPVVGDFNDRAEFDSDLNVIREYLQRQTMRSEAEPSMDSRSYSVELRTIEDSLNRLAPFPQQQSER